jgi:hypothetical protein
MEQVSNVIFWFFFSSGILFWVCVGGLLWYWKALKKLAVKRQPVNEARKIKENVIAIVKPVEKNAILRSGNSVPK